MPEHSTDKINKLLVKSMDFNIFLANFTKDLKIEDSFKDTKIVKSDILYNLVNYYPIRCSGLAKLRRQLTDKWF